LKQAGIHTADGATLPPEPSSGEAAREFHDRLAPDYDDLFSRNGSGDWIRRRVQNILLQKFKRGDRVLELNCGTGTDAVFLASHGIHVTATDISPRMVEMAGQKARTLGLESMISTAVVDSTNPASLPERNFDGAFSNFDGLNYLDDVGVFADRIGALLKPGAPLICTVLNRVCLWEVLYFAGTMRPGRALRRVTRRAEELMREQKPMVLRLYFPREFAAYFSRDFLAKRTTAFGLLLPPAGLRWLHTTGKRVLENLEWWEGLISGIYPAYNFSDHYVVEFERRSGPAPKSRSVRILRRGVHALAMRAYVRRKTAREDHTSMFGFLLRVPPTVFHPGLFRTSRFLGEYLMGKDFRGKTLLEVGCGSGILSLIAARGGASVTSVDINPKAVEAARLNAAANGLAGKMTVLRSNLFEALRPDERFDLIVWNPPFYPEEPADDASRAWMGGGAHRVIEQFAESAGSYLRERGAIVLVLSSDVDIGRILSFFTSNRSTSALASSRRFLFETLSIYEFRPK